MSPALWRNILSCRASHYISLDRLLSMWDGNHKYNIVAEEGGGRGRAMSVESLLSIVQVKSVASAGPTARLGNRPLTLFPILGCILIDRHFLSSFSTSHLLYPPTVSPVPVASFYANLSVVAVPVRAKQSAKRVGPPPHSCRNSPVQKWIQVHSLFLLFRQ